MQCPLLHHQWVGTQISKDVPFVLYPKSLFFQMHLWKEQIFKLSSVYLPNVSFWWLVVPPKTLFHSIIKIDNIYKVYLPPEQM